METKQVTLPTGLSVSTHVDAVSGVQTLILRCEDCSSTTPGSDLATLRLRHKKSCDTKDLQVIVTYAQVTPAAPAPVQVDHDTTGLVGSAKQVAWAARIRAAFATAIEPALERARTDSSISYLIRDEVARLLEVELRAELEQTSAARWIDRYRDDRPTTSSLAWRTNRIAKRNEIELRELARERLAKERIDRQRGADVLKAEGGDTNPTEAERAAARMALVRDEIE